MNLGKLIELLKLGRKVGKVQSAIRREEQMGYDPKKSLLKGLLAFVKASISIVAVVGLPALFNYWTPEQIAEALRTADASPVLIAVCVPLVHAVLSVLQNWWKNRARA